MSCPVFATILRLPPLFLIILRLNFLKDRFRDIETVLLCGLLIICACPKTCSVPVTTSMVHLWKTFESVLGYDKSKNAFAPECTSRDSRTSHNCITQLPLRNIGNISNPRTFSQASAPPSPSSSTITCTSVTTLMIGFPSPLLSISLFTALACASALPPNILCDRHLRCWLPPLLLLLAVLLLLPGA